MFFYWIFDNIQIITQLKLRTGDAEYWGKLGMINWSISLVFNLIQYVRQLFQLNQNLKDYQDLIAKNPEKRESFKDNIKSVKQQRFDVILNLIKTFGDILPAFKGASMIF